jgi:hypothetical protein
MARAQNERGFAAARPYWRKHPMKILSSFVMAGLLSGFGVSLLAFQGRYYDDDEAPAIVPGGEKSAEWTFARFHYRVGNEFGGFRGFQRWAADYPKSDRQFVMGVRRLTRLHARPIEEVVDADSEAMYDWPWIYIEDPGGWDLTQAQATRMRDYLLRGGFIFADDTHGDYEWGVLAHGLEMMFPDRSIEDLNNDDEIFHVFYDLDERFQIPGTRYIWGNRRYTTDSAVPKWRAIRDDQGRIMVAICHNSDVGDAWEWADSPRYPERDTSLAYRIGINYIIYGMTH